MNIHVSQKYLSNFQWICWNIDKAEQKILNQERGYYDLGQLKEVYDGIRDAGDVTLTSISVSSVIKNNSGQKFRIPFPETDLTSNPNLLEDPVEYDFSQVEYAK